MFILLLPRCLRVAQTLVTHIYSLMGHPSRAALQCLVGVSLPLLDLQQDRTNTNVNQLYVSPLSHSTFMTALKVRTLPGANA